MTERTDFDDHAAPDASVFLTVSRISRWIVVLTLLFAVLAGLSRGVPAAIGALVGGGLASAEWIVSAWIAQKVATAGGSRSFWALLFGLKTLTLIGLAGLAVLFLDPTGLAIGFGALVVGAIGGAMESMIRGDSNDSH